MSPPTEQLIRDYLNRLSLAARGRLGAEDRRALVSRTHDFIDRTASPAGPPTPMEVAALLSRLGDPTALVDQEVARLAAARGETAAAEPAERPEKLPGRLRRLSAHSSWHWPAAPGSEDLRTRLLNGNSGPGDDGAGTEAAETEAAETEAAAWPAEAARPGPERPPPIWVPRQPGPADGLVPPAATRPAPPEPTEPPDAAGTTAGLARPAWPSAAALSARGQGTATGADDGRDQSPAAWQNARDSRAAALLTRVRASARRLLDWARRNPVEAAAVTLLGLGGAAFPPVWLLGVLAALASRAWDYRDRWIGLAGPVLLLVVGTALGVTLGNRYDSFGPYVHEGWLYADILSRVGAVAGTAYLVWRLAHARRAPTVPPWNRPHRVD
jgi:hypothetical protein